jgi:hypothetical protein
MPHIALADLESVLRAHKLDRTLPNGLAPPADDRSFAQSAISLLDQQLGGGLPRGQISEIVGSRSSGRTALLLTFLAAATSRGEVVALIDTLDQFDPPSAAEAGLDLTRLLWIRGEASAIAAGPVCSRREARIGWGARQALADRSVDRALKALNLVLQAGGFGVVAIDLADVPCSALRRVPFTTWLRLQRVIDGRDVACVIVGAERIARSSAGLTLACSTARMRWSGADRPGMRLLRGLDIETRVNHARGCWMNHDRACEIRVESA